MIIYATHVFATATWESLRWGGLFVVSASMILLAVWLSLRSSHVSVAKETRTEVETLRADLNNAITRLDSVERKPTYPGSSARPVYDNCEASGNGIGFQFNESSRGENFKLTHYPSFSCGAASAVATKLICAEYPAERVVILRAWILEEHEDISRCERINYAMLMISMEALEGK